MRISSTPMLSAWLSCSLEYANMPAYRPTWPTAPTAPNMPMNMPNALRDFASRSRSTEWRAR